MDTASRRRSLIQTESLLEIVSRIKVRSFGDRAIRYLDDAGDRWIVFSDICKALGYKNPNHESKKVDPEEKRKLDIGLRNTLAVCINRRGLLRFVLLANKPEASEFLSWATREIFSDWNDEHARYSESPEISLIERKPRRSRRRHTRDFCLFGAHNAASCAAFVQNSLSRPIGAQPATERRRCTISRRRTSAASAESTSNTGRISRRTSSPTAAFPAARRSIWPITRKLAPIRRCGDAHYHRSRQCSGRTGHWHKGADCSGFGAIRRYPCGVGRGSAANIPANADWRDCQPAGWQEEVRTDWGELLRRFRN